MSYAQKTKQAFNLDNATIKLVSTSARGHLMVIVTGKDNFGDKYSKTRHLRYSPANKSYYGNKLDGSVGVYVNFGMPDEWEAKEKSRQATATVEAAA